jgi:thiol-disulfide isomerase/thioredoxin
MSTADSAERIEPPTTLPRWIAGILITVIAAASLVSLAWPLLQLERPASAYATSRSGVIYAQIEEPGAAGRIQALAPNFAWYDPSGKDVRLSDFRGKLVVVNFWATNCQACLREMPALNRVARSEPDVVFLEINIKGMGESVERVESFLERLAVERLTPLLDTQLATATRFGVFSLPTTFFIDRDGVIRHLEIGAPSVALGEDQIKRGIAKAR